MHRLKDIYPKNILLTLYNSLIVPHLNYCILTWGSKIVNGHKIHILQKKALRIITDSDYIAHSEPICKELRLLKVTDMFQLTIWKLYYKLMNNLLPPYFNSMKPKLPELCNVYSIRKPTFHLPVIRHGFARQLIGYKLLELLNTEPGTLLVSSKVHTHSFIGFKIYIKNKVIDSYSYICNKVFCESCRRLT